MRLLVTGASSFVGAHFCRLASREHYVYGQYFSTPLRLPHIQPVRLDLTHSMAATRLQELDVDVVVHIACKIKGQPQDGEDVAAAALRENQQMMSSILSMKKAMVYASSTVVHWQSDAPYVQSRRQDEERLMNSGLDYVILRPSAPYGPRLRNHCPRHKESFHTLTDLIQRSPVVPVVGSGEYRRQPVHVDDFSQAILDCLAKPSLPNRGFDIGGKNAHSFRQIINLLQIELGVKRQVLSIPKSLMAYAAKWMPNLEPSLIRAIDEDELADPSDLADYLGWTPRDFSIGVKDVLS